MYKWALIHGGTIEQAPLQAYSSALIFSPVSSLTRQLFNSEEPDWIIRKPQTPEDWFPDAEVGPWNDFRQDQDPYDDAAAWSDMTMFISPNGCRMVCGLDDNTAEIWDMESRTCISVLQECSNQTNPVPFSTDVRRVAFPYKAAGDTYNAIGIWDVESGTCISTLKGHRAAVVSVAFSPDGQYIASGSDDRTIKIWDTKRDAASACISTLECHEYYVFSVAFSPDGRYIASVLSNKTIKIWDTERDAASACILTLEGHEYYIISVAFSPDGCRVASYSDDQTIKIWDAKTGTCISTFATPSGGVTQLRFDSTGFFLHTNIGIISLEDRPIEIVSGVPSAVQRSTQGGYGIRDRGDYDWPWITWRGQNVLRLPRYFVASAIDVSKLIIYVCGPGWSISSIKFAADKSPLA